MTQSIEQSSKGNLFANRYEIIETLGEGGMGKVYLVRDTLIKDQKVALKVLKPELSSNSEHVENFVGEVELNRKLNHPNVVRIFDVGRSNQAIYYTMEYVEGISLKDKIMRGPLPAEEVTRILKEIANGLAALHEVGIIHRDLKPGNIMLEVAAGAKITDLGIARKISAELSSSSELLGSAEYIAPELWKGKPPSTRSDIYSLGVILYEMLNGKPPFSEGDASDLMRQHLVSPPAEIKNDTAPSYLKRLCFKMLSKNDFDRPASCYEVLQKLSAGTSSSITHDDFVRPAILGIGKATPSNTKSQTNLPDYSALKKITNPGSYSTSISEERAQNNNDSSIRRYSTRPRQNSHSLNAYAVPKDTANIGQMLASLAIVLSVILFANIFMLPWERLAQSSTRFEATVPFYFSLFQCLIGLAAILSAPTAIVAIFRPSYMRDKKFLLVWGEAASIVILLCLAMFSWTLFSTSNDLLRAFTENPAFLHATFKKTTELVVYATLFIPHYAVNDQSAIYYTCLLCYALGVFAVFQTGLPGKGAILTTCIILLPAFLSAEYLIPSNFSFEIIRELTTQTVSLPLGSREIVMSQYSLICGAFNWSMILLLVRYLRGLISIFIPQ